MRQRLGVPRSAVKKAAAKALECGVRREDCHGSLRRYLDALYFYNERANNLRVWSEKVYIFRDKTLITVLNLPQQYKNRANGISKKESAND